MEKEEKTEIMELTILMPCLNEAANIAFSVTEARAFLDSHNICGEVLVVDNGSIDDSVRLAVSHGARVITEPETGYGNALRCGIQNALGKYIIIGDCDSTYRFDNLMPLLSKLREGYTFVIGNRFAGNIEKGAMPFSHRYIGVPFLSWLGRVKYRVPITDFHCGIRGFDASLAKEMDYKATGMEFATEIIVLFAKANANIAQVPVDLRVSQAKRKPHLRAIRDGLRHVKYILFN